MKDEKKIENDLDEVIFEKRNKEYGAYFLRKTYDKNVSKALSITITLLFLVVVIPLIANYLKDDRFFRIGPAQGPDVIVLDGPKDDPPPPPPPPPPPEVKTNKMIYIAPKVGEDSTDQGVIFTQAEMNELGNNERFNDTLVIIDVNQNDKKVIDDGKDNIIHEYSGVEEKPDFPGGTAEMNKFLVENIKYPKLASDNNIQGKVHISFIVEADGSLSNIKILNGIGAGCDEEAERVVKLMPKWNPGKQNNQGVRVKVMMPIRFTMVNY